VWRDLKHARWQDQAIRGNDQDVRPRGDYAIEHALIVQIFRLIDVQAAGTGQPLDRALGSAQAAPGRPVRLRQYKRNVMAGIKQRRQRARCELWSTGEN
jgi:hypothetical protein